MRRRSSTRFSGQCLPTPLPEISTTASQCVEIVEGNCIDLLSVNGSTFSHTIIIPQANKEGLAVTGYMPNAAGSASLTLADASCLTVGDCLLMYGICEGACDSIDGYYTVTGVADNVVAVAEEIPGTPGDAVTFTSSASSLCNSASNSAQVSVLTDLTNVELEMSVYNRMGRDYKYNSMTVVAGAGSNQLNVCPKGQVCLYDCVSVPDLGIENAQVSDVFPNSGYDTIVLKDQIAQTATDCALLNGGNGKITDFRIDRTQEACGTITFYLDAAEQEVGGVTYLGTSDFKESDCSPAVKGDDCEARYMIGQYAIKATYTSPTNGRVESVYVQHGKLYGQFMGSSCA